MAMASIFWLEGNEIDADENAVQQVNIEEECNNLPALKEELSKYFLITPRSENKLCLGILRVHGKQIISLKDFVAELYIKKYWTEPKEKTLSKLITHEVEKLKPIVLESRQLTDEFRSILEINRIPDVGEEEQRQLSPETLFRALEQETESESMLMIASRITDQLEVPHPLPGATGPIASTPRERQKVSVSEIMIPISLEQREEETQVTAAPIQGAELLPPSEVAVPSASTPHEHQIVTQPEVETPVALEQEAEVAVASCQGAQLQPQPEVTEPSDVLQLEELTEQTAAQSRRITPIMDNEISISSDIIQKWQSDPRRWLRVKDSEADIIDIRKLSQKDIFKKSRLRNLPQQLMNLYQRHLVTHPERTYPEEEQLIEPSSILLEETSGTAEAPAPDVTREPLERITEESHPAPVPEALPEPVLLIPEATTEAPPMTPKEIAPPAPEVISEIPPLAPEVVPGQAVPAIVPPASDAASQVALLAPKTVSRATPPAPEGVSKPAPPAAEAVSRLTPVTPEPAPVTVPPAHEAVPGSVPPAPQAVPGAAPLAPQTVPGAVPPGPKAVPGSVPLTPEAVPGAAPPAPEAIPGAVPPVPKAVQGDAPAAPEAVPGVAPPVPEAFPEVVPPPHDAVPEAAPQPQATDERQEAGSPTRSQVLKRIHELQRKNKPLTVMEVCRGVGKRCAVLTFKKLLEMHEDQLISLHQDLQSCPPVTPLPPIVIQNVPPRD